MYHCVFHFLLSFFLGRGGWPAVACWRWYINTRFDRRNSIGILKYDTCNQNFPWSCILNNVNEIFFLYQSFWMSIINLQS
jgi:hypothetical protein